MLRIPAHDRNENEVVMLNFRELQITDRPVLSALYSGAKGHGCEYSFTGMFLWGRQQIAFVDDVPLFFCRFGDWYTYQYPFTTPELIPYLLDDAKERGLTFRLFGLTAEEVQALEETYPNRFSYTAVRDSADYVYRIERLADLTGKKLQAKRNHCNRFEAAYPDYRVIPLTTELLPRCRDFTERWYDAHTEGGAEEDYVGERIAIARAFDNFEALHLEGILLETSDGMVAFSMGSHIRPDTFDVHFEKALAEVNGAYPMVNREFARLLHARYPELRWLNREDDMGIEGLRRAKESYFPDVLLEKFVAEEKA